MAVELDATAVGRVLADLGQRDEQLAQDAADALHAVTGRESEAEPVMVSRHRLQLFLWYELPRKWDAPPDELRRVAHALGDVLEAAGAPARYAALCRSAETELMIETEADGFVELIEASGLDPPDTAVLEWSDLMTIEEAEERDAAALFLEQAIERGELDPGAEGWRERQMALVEQFLLAPGAGGDTPLVRIRAARIESWLGHSGERRDLLERALPLLAAPEPDVELASRSVEPLLWLLDRVEEGVQLTQTRSLARSVVREAVEHYPFWWHGELFGPPHRERDVRPLEQLHAFALALKLVRPHRRELRLTRLGRALRADPPALHTLVVHDLAAAAPALPGDVDLGLAILLADRQQEEAPYLDVLAAHQLLSPFAGIEGRLTEPITLTEGGRTLAVAILRERATGPRRFVW